MALGDRFILYVPDVHDGYRYRARIQQEGAASVVELLPALDRAAELFAGEQGVQDPAAPLVRSSMSFRILRTQGALVSVFGEAMDAFPVIWERQLLSANPTTGPWSTIWRGFLHTRYYEDAPDAFVDEVVLKAHDGIELLKTREYEGVTNSDSVWTTLTGILGGLGFVFGYETIMRWYPYLSSQRTSRIIEYLYTQDERWGDENEEDLRLSEYDVLVDLLGRFQLQLVQSEGAFHLRQRFNLTGSQSVVEVYNSSGVYTGTGTVDTVNVDPITELQGRPRSFLSQVRQAQSTHDHGELTNLVVNDSFEVDLSNWEVLRAGVTRVPFSDIVSDAPDANDQYAAKITVGATGSEGGLRQGGTTLLARGPNNGVRFAFEYARDLDDLTDQNGTLQLRASYDLSDPSNGYFLQAAESVIVRPWLKGEDAPLFVEALTQGGLAPWVEGQVLMHPGAMIYMVELRSGSMLEGNLLASMRITREVRVGDRVLYGDIDNSFGDVPLKHHVGFATGQFKIRFFIWSPFAPTTYRIDNWFAPDGGFGHVEIGLANVTPFGQTVEGFLQYTFGAGDALSGAADSGHWAAYDAIDLAIVDYESRPIERTIAASSTGTPQDDTETLGYSFLTGDGPTALHRARLSVLDGSGVRQELTTGWKNGPYTSGEASTQLSIDALHTRLSIRQRKKHLAVRRITFLLHEGESIWPHHVITRGGVNYTIGRYERRFGTGQVYTELVELFQGSDDGISDAVVQEGPSAQGTGGRTLLAVSSGGGGGATDWASITGKPPLVNTFNTRSGDITLTSADVTGALGFTPISLATADARYVNVTGDTMTGDLVMASGTLKINTDHLILDADGAAPGYVKLSSGRIGQQIGAGGTFQPFARTNAAETISAAWNFQNADVTIQETSTSQYTSAGLLFNHTAPAAGQREFEFRLQNNAPGGGGSASFYLRHYTAANRSTWRDVATYDLSTQGLALSANAITLSSPNVYATGNVGTSDFVSRTTGWRIDEPGNADFRSIYADELVVQAFTADVAQTLVGSEYITKSRATLAADFTVPAVGATATLTVENLADVEIGPGAQVFASGDTIRLRYINRATGLTVGDAWGTVTNYVNNGDGTQSYTWTSRKLSSGVQGKTIFKGSVALDYGKSGDKLIVSTVLDAAGSPYTRMLQWTDTNGDFAPDTYTVLASMGNLGGITGTVAGQAVSGYGFYSDNFFGRGVFAVTRGYVGDNGEVLLGSSFQSADFTSGRIMVGRTAGGSAIVSLRGVTGLTDHVSLVASSTARGFQFEDSGIEYAFIGRKLVSGTWTLSSHFGPWNFTNKRFSASFGGNAVEIGERSTVATQFGFVIDAATDVFMLTQSDGKAYLGVSRDINNEIVIGDDYRSVLASAGMRIRVGGTDVFKADSGGLVVSANITASTITGTVSVSGGEIVAGGGSVTLNEADGILLAAGETARNAIKWGDGTTWIRGNNNDLTLHADVNINLGNAATFPEIRANGAFRVVQSVATFDRYLNIPIYNYDGTGHPNPDGLTPYEAPNPVYGRLFITRNNVGNFFVRVYLPDAKSVVLN